MDDDAKGENMEIISSNRSCSQRRFLLYARPLALLMYISIMDMKQFIPYPIIFSPPTASTTRTSRRQTTTFTQNNSVYPDRQPTNSTRSTSKADDPDTFMGIKARAWDKWQGEVPCFPPTWHLPRHQGLLYNKLLKTGGSTGAGINARIARNQAQRINATFAACDGNLKHSPAHILCGPHRNRTLSFLWTTVREATSRIVSQFFFFDVSRYKNEPSDARFVQYVQENVLDPGLMSTCNHYMKLLYPDKNQSQFKLDPIAYVSKILAEYDFISVTSRMDESAVTLAMLLGVPLADVLYLNAKQNGGYDEGGFQQRCTYIEPSFTSRGMADFMHHHTNPWFQKCTHWDDVLHQIANRSLDLTIESINNNRAAAQQQHLGGGDDGRLRFFERHLQKFQQARARAEERCQPKMPCTAQGEKLNYTETDCLWADSGCGYACLDDVATELDLWQMDY